MAEDIAAYRVRREKAERERVLAEFEDFADEWWRERGSEWGAGVNAVSKALQQLIAKLRNAP